MKVAILQRHYGYTPLHLRPTHAEPCIAAKRKRPFQKTSAHIALPRTESQAFKPQKLLACFVGLVASHTFQATNGVTQALVPLNKVDRAVNILIGAKRRYFYCAALGNLSALTALVEVIQHENEEA